MAGEIILALLLNAVHLLVGRATHCLDGGGDREKDRHPDADADGQAQFPGLPCSARRTFSITACAFPKHLMHNRIL
jgi:hypothetical protein